MNGDSISARRALACCAANDDQPRALAGDSGAAPVTGPHGEQRSRALLRLLDREPPSARAIAVLLLTGAAFAYVFLSRYPGFALLRPIFTGSDAARYSAQAWPRLTVPHLTGDCLLAAIVGVVAGAATRRLRWLIPPLIVAAVTCAAIAIYLVSSATGRPVGSSTFVRYHLDMTALGGAYAGAVLLGAALGGLFSPRLARRVPVSVSATAALTWIMVAVLGRLFASWWIARYSDVAFDESSLAEFTLTASNILPYVVGGAFMPWVLRRPSLWMVALILGALSALQVLSGAVRMWSPGGQGVNVLNEILWVLKPFASAAAGAWLAEAVLALRPWRDLVGHGLIVVVIIIVAAMVGYWATWRHETAGSFSRSSAVEPPVIDGEIVLLKRGSAIGIIVPTRQTSEPERIAYDWYYRTDGGGTFRAQDAGKYRRGHVERAKEVRFGPFSVSWSVHSDGSGYLYYDKFGGSTVAPDDVRICVTHETDLERINAYDPRWVFKGSPTDPGIRLTAPVSAPGKQGRTRPNAQHDVAPSF